VNVGEVFTEIAKAIPLETIAPKPAAGAAGGRRAQGTQEQNRVELGQEGGAKKGGCC